MAARVAIPPASPDSHRADDTLCLHASAVALAGRGLLILGRAGAGKSGLALSLMAFGASLVADDRTLLRRTADGAVLLSAPAGIAGRIEARGVGILAADQAGSAFLAAAVDLDSVETERLPPRREWPVLGTSVPLFHKVESAHFAPALLQYLRGGRAA